MGAAIHAASLVGAAESPDSMLLDVTPLDLRIGVAGGLAEPIIERNTPVPIEQTRSFTTDPGPCRRASIIKVYQGDRSPGRRTTSCSVSSRSAGFEKGLPAATTQIDVTFEINADGIVNVTAADQATGEAASTQITLSSGLAEEQIERIIEQDVAGRVASAARAQAQAEREIQAITIAGDDSETTPATADGAEESPFGDGSEDLSVGRDDAIDIGLDSTDTSDLDLIDDDELIELAQEAAAAQDAPDHAITLDIPAEEADGDLFDTSGSDLTNPGEEDK